MIDHKLSNAIHKLNDTFIKQKSKAVKLMNEHKQLQEALAIMCSNADEDCPSEYRTEHFRSAMNDAYALLRKVGYFKKEKQWD